MSNAPFAKCSSALSRGRRCYRLSQPWHDLKFDILICACSICILQVISANQRRFICYVHENECNSIVGGEISILRNRLPMLLLRSRRPRRDMARVFAAAAAAVNDARA